MEGKRGNPAPSVLETGRKSLAVSRDVRGDSSAARLPGVRESCGSYRVCEVARPATPHRGAIPSRGVRRARRHGTQLPVGRRVAKRASWKFQLPPVGPRARRFASSRSERVRRAGSSRQWVGVDAHDLCTFPGLCTLPLLPGVLREFLRREALRDEGWFTAYGRLHASAVVSQLVRGALRVRLRNFPLRGVIIQNFWSQLADSG